ncbi:hypothetical protein [Novacetimonas pomaceti]|uniref:Uncharacterized protein n=1 Tax=Novacetimonas pomaceti TaxID=2021998 RepID=A0A318QIE2_9PROT|nr:hypothetical protein [Novacetimonas pomaceti]PYD75129.1 hypothetical protein CFR71_10990 [Novacetimonas pomaceti]
MIDRDWQVEALRRMEKAGGTIDPVSLHDGDEQKCARNLLDLELQGLSTGGVSATPQGFRVGGACTITDAGRRFLARPENMEITLDGPTTVAALRQRVLDDASLSDGQRQDLLASLETMHPLTLKGLGRDLLNAAVAEGPHAIPLLRRHTGN